MESASLELGQNIALATWNRPRSSEELVSFINQRHACLPDDIELDDSL